MPEVQKPQEIQVCWSSTKRNEVLMEGLVSYILVLGLSGFTLTFMLFELDGPGDIFKNIRAKIGIIERKSDGVRIIEKPSFMTSLFSCFWCLTTWVCLFLAIFTTIMSDLSWYAGIYLWLASICISGIIFTGVNR